MNDDKVTMSHPGTGGRFDAPARAVKIYERSGWVVAADVSEKAPAEPTSDAPAHDDPAPDNSAKAGPRAAKATTKEEGK